MTGHPEPLHAGANLYLLWHFRIGAEEDWDEDDTEVLAGIYSSEAQARAAIARLRDKPGFCDWPHGFRIFGDTLDEDSWTGGFISWDEA